METMRFSVRARSETPTRTIVEARGFKIVIDEPEGLGGTDHGANPVEFVLAALAGCLNVVGHIVAREMAFTLRGIELQVEGDLDPARFLGESRAERAGYKAVRVVVKPVVAEGADPAVLERWLEVVEDRCPVSDSIGNSTPVQIALAQVGHPEVIRPAG